MRDSASAGVIDEAVRAIRMDTLIGSLPEPQQAEIYGNAVNIIDRRQGSLSFRAQMVGDDKKNYRRHDIELIKKFTLSVACLIFFFIVPVGSYNTQGGTGHASGDIGVAFPGVLYHRQYGL